MSVNCMEEKYKLKFIKLLIINSYISFAVVIASFPFHSLQLQWPSFPFGTIKDSSRLIWSSIRRAIVWLLTADVEGDGVTPLSARVLKAAVESVVAQVHLGQNQSGTLYTVLGLHIRPVHLPWHWCVIVQGAALHGDVTAHSLILAPSNWKQTEAKIKC